MEKKINLSGVWQVHLPDGTTKEAQVPGTLDENAIGYPDVPEKQWGDGQLLVSEDGTARITTRFTRKYTFIGEARWSRKLELSEIPADCRMIF